MATTSFVVTTMDFIGHLRSPWLYPTRMTRLVAACATVFTVSSLRAEGFGSTLDKISRQDCDALLQNFYKPDTYMSPGFVRDWQNSGG